MNWNGSSPFIYVAPTLSYDLQNVYLTLARNNVLISSAGETPNERAVGRALDYGGLSGNFGRALLLQTNQKAVKSLLSQLTGEAHQSLLSALQQSSSHTRDTINDRLRDAFTDDGPIVWSRAINTDSTTKSYPEYSSLKQNSTALFVGADITIVEDIRTGIMAGISNTDFNVDTLGSSAHSNSYHIGAYGSWNYEDWRLSLGSAYSWHNISMKRSFPILVRYKRLRVNIAQIAFRSSVKSVTSSNGMRLPSSHLVGWLIFRQTAIVSTSMHLTARSGSISTASNHRCATLSHRLAFVCRANGSSKMQCSLNSM